MFACRPIFVFFPLLRPSCRSFPVCLHPKTKNKTSMKNPRVNSVIRLLAVCAVIFAPVSNESKFYLSGVFVVMWAIEPLLRAWMQCNPNEPPSRKAVVYFLTAALLVAPVNVHAQEAPPPRDGEAVTLIEAALAVAIVAIIGYGYYRCHVKGKKVAKKVGREKARQIEDTNPWPDDPTPSDATNSIAGKTSGTLTLTEYGAWFFEPMPATGPDDCECRPMPVIEWVTPEIGQAQPRFYFPAEPIELGDYLANHGLTESTNANYSFNGEPTPNAPAIFTYTNRTLTFAIPGTVNRIQILQRSPDLARWETIFTVKSPARMVNNFADGTLAEAGRQFYRVLVLP